MNQIVNKNHGMPGKHIIGELTYMVRQEEKPYFESSMSTGGEPKIFFNTEKCPTAIGNMRNISKSLSIDINGFELISHCSDVADFYEDELIETQYNKELDLFLKERTGADRVVIFDHTRRSNAINGANNPDGKRGPAVRVHADYTIKSGPQRAMDTLGKEEFERILTEGGRVIQVNVWRPINGPVESAPLALADSASIPANDLIATDQRFPNRVGEIYSLAHGTTHRWYYAPQMTSEEVILIKGWDSIDDGRARFTPHGAFDHPDQTENSKPRESIETRTYLVFKN
tara:strand:- start:75 stop:932 length:858 start_codon:yes stop_codon:yes gene_type:complete